MLTSLFAENSNTVSGERKVYDVVEETDFVTIYWYLIWNIGIIVVEILLCQLGLVQRHDDPHILVALLKHTSYLVGSDGVSALTKLSKQAEFRPAIVPNIVMLLRDSNATVQSNGELPLVKLSELGGHYSPCVCTMEYRHRSSFQNEVYEKHMHYIMKFSVNPKRPSTITTGGITIGIGAVT
ncbi:hypothetical protein BU17DRAFT_60028 [Hysterangium stoloniferum]|nr:hypothetical protein BU17DRAFT_60028 [Hysterangium stoloniferum]